MKPFLAPKSVWFSTLLALFVMLSAVTPRASLAANYVVLGWNDYGFDRIDSDYSVFSLQPPGNNIRAQFIYQGSLVKLTNGMSLTYQAVGDSKNSTNSTSQGKSDFWQFAPQLFGTNLAPDMGLNGYAMPGTNNVPQSMTFNSTSRWFFADGIPLTPIDDSRKVNYYPMLRVIARSNNIALATNDLVTAISDEVNCRVCHASGTATAARPTNGWVWNTNPERDYRLNILRMHDELRNPATYPGILSSNGYNPAGLYRTVVADGRPVLCTKCHKSTIVPGSGFGGIKALTASIHSIHAQVTDPDTGLALDATLTRSSCYHCHPGPVTRSLRGAMGDSVSTNGHYAMECQDCHGDIQNVGSVSRTGWIDVPDCQSCHVGNATVNGGKRYPTTFTDTNSWTVRTTTDRTFATITNAAFGNYSLYRYSTNHGTLFCAACHGATHAEFPSALTNDNIRSIRAQGHVGMLSECVTCHTDGRAEGGPHGMHAADNGWADPGGHGGPADSSCDNCHGTTQRGTELSEMKSDHTVTTSYGTKGGFRGYRVGCYTCHNGAGIPGSITSWKVPSIASVTNNTTSGLRVLIPLPVKDTNTSVQPLWVRVISQPGNANVGITNWQNTNWAAIFIPEPGFVGTNQFTFAAWNGYVDSALRTGTVAVAQGPFSISAKVLVPLTYPAAWAAPFSVVPAPSNIVGAVTYEWDFGDFTAPSTNQFATHVYPAAGSYNWKVISRVQGGIYSASTTNFGTILIEPAVSVAAARVGGSILLTWPQSTADALLEQSPVLGPAAVWTICPNPVVTGGGTLSVTVPNAGGMMYYRLRKL